MTTVVPEPGFVRAVCAACGDDDVWLQCNGCGERSRFLRGEAEVRCSCGATYSHAVCTCGQQVPFAQLVSVPFAQGPASWSDFEVAWDRVAVGVVAAAAAVGGGWWWRRRS